MAVEQPRAAISAASSSSVRPASWRERPSQATANSRPSARPERRARVAAVGDVGVELGLAGAEALAVVRAAEDRRAVADQQRAGLQEVAARLGGQLVARGDRATPPWTCTHARTSAQGASNGTCRRATPRVRTSPSGDAVRPHEEAADQRLVDAARGAPRLEPRLAAQDRDAQLGRAASWRATWTRRRAPSGSSSRAGGRGRRVAGRSGSTEANAMSQDGRARADGVNSPLA